MFLIFFLEFWLINLFDVIFFLCKFIFWMGLYETQALSLWKQFLEYLKKKKKKTIIYYMDYIFVVSGWSLV